MRLARNLIMLSQSAKMLTFVKVDMPEPQPLKVK